MAATRTHKYLFPSVLLGYDLNFTKFLSSLDRKKLIINSFLGDMEYSKITNNCLFLLIQSNPDMNVIKDNFFVHKCYKDDYPTNNAHMFVLECPGPECYNWFILSRYSKMYSKHILDKYFRDVNGVYLPSYHVLSKTETKRLEIINNLGLDSDWDGLEYDDKLKMQDEIYNFQLTLV